jgi:hypothetical protein
MPGEAYGAERNWHGVDSGGASYLYRRCLLPDVSTHNTFSQQAKERGAVYVVGLSAHHSATLLVVGFQCST